MHISSNILFVVFHAGLGQDISAGLFDPTIYDIHSAYIDEDMINNLEGNESNLVGYWKLNETKGLIVNDLSSNNNFGTLINNPIRTTNIDSEKISLYSYSPLKIISHVLSFVYDKLHPSKLPVSHVKYNKK